MARGAWVSTASVIAIVLGAGMILAGDADVTHAGKPTPAPQLNGTWAWEGTGPSGLVAHGIRLATLSLHQHGHALSGTLRTGTHSYLLVGTYYYPKPTITLRYSLKRVATVRFSGALQHGGTRILGQWTDARHNDGGAILVKVTR